MKAKRIIALVLAIVLMLSLSLSVFAEAGVGSVKLYGKYKIPKGTKKYKDVSTKASYYTAVMYCRVQGYMLGNKKNEFRPYDYLTRGEACQIFYDMTYKFVETHDPGYITWVKSVSNPVRIAMDDRGYGIEMSLSEPFTDVSSKHANYKAIAWCYNHGIFSGITKDHFYPNAYISRAELAEMILEWRAVVSTGTKSDFNDGLIAKGSWRRFSKSYKCKWGVLAHGASKAYAKKVYVTYRFPYKDKDKFGGRQRRAAIMYVTRTGIMKPAYIIAGDKYFDPNACIRRYDMAETVYRMMWTKYMCTDYYWSGWTSPYKGETDNKY